MCLLWLIFVVPMLVIFALPFIALAYGMTAVASKIQKKKEEANGDQTQATLSEAGKQRVANQVGLCCFVLLCLFLGFLMLRYTLT